MSNPTTLPADWPPLREAARSMAEQVFSVPRWHGLGDVAGAASDTLWNDLRGEARERALRHVAALLADFTRSASRDFWARWLRERGHDLRWAEDEPEVLAWSVLSVSRGGDVIRAIDDVPRFVNTRCSLAQFAGASFWWCATAEDRDFFIGPDGKHHGWYFAGMFGPETGDAAIQIVCGHALADRCALRNEDGSLILPELPEVTRG